MSQQLLTAYYKTSKVPETDSSMKRHSLSLRKSVSTAKRKLEIKPDPDGDSTIVISSDDDIDNKNFLLKDEPPNLSQGSVDSNTSSQTILYSPEISIKTEKDVQTLHSESSSPVCPRTPATTPSKSSVTPSKRKKFFSPNSKRRVTVKTNQNPNKPYLSVNKRLFQNVDVDDEPFVKASEGLDDKTIFLLSIINDFLKSSMKNLLSEPAVTLLSDYFHIPKLGMKLVCRLYWRKEGWYKKEELGKIWDEKHSGNLDEVVTNSMLTELVEKKFLLAGSTDNMTFKELTNLLKADQIKEICKELKIKTQNKKSAVEALEDFGRRPSIAKFFTDTGTQNNSKRVLQIMRDKAGPCYQLSDLTRETLGKLYLLMYLSIDYDIIRTKKLEFMLINEKILRETFPVDHSLKIDNASLVFENAEEFERYWTAHCLHEEFLACEKHPEERCNYVTQVYLMYQDIPADCLIRYKSLPKWLQRFTPASIYLKIMDIGIADLKRKKCPENSLFAVEVLNCLLAQTFKQYKKGDWYAEKALILHSYLSKPEEAAKVLIEGFEADISDIAKDCMRPRAKKIAHQKNIHLDDNTRQTLLAFSTKETIMENNIPSIHFYKQPLDNPTKGKIMFETKTENGRITQGVEEYAISEYILSGEYTHGHHCEGAIFSTLFSLLFWDIIYSVPATAPGVFLCRYQRFPLDMHTEDFYNNRREAIEERLRVIENASEEELIDMMWQVWDTRPEYELSGISRSLGWDCVAGAAGCLRGARAAAVCRRVAPRRVSGAPDLVLYHEGTRQIKFVEVKSDMDKPSLRQIQWMQFLLAHDIPTEFCYVGANTTRQRSRRPPAAPKTPA
ncbi:fanconi-associated nuclease 1 [Plutella xylostella]|uniref:fanconi-associated nuclease 1 n=1 Tax=Plutella xylostella TaxID=51655 RepID=UPI002032658A|nr:fanconi-associated nuclease 1 [Plutella xylostella]